MPIEDLAGIRHGILVPAAVLIFTMPTVTYIDYVARRVLSVPLKENPPPGADEEKPKNWPSRVLMSLRYPSAAMMPKPAAKPEDPEASAKAQARHRSFLEEDARSFESMLVCGSIGLAAWSLLFVSGDLAVVKQISGLTMGFLFIGSAWLLVAPMIWRSGGTYSTTLGKESAFQIGFAFIALALCSIVMDLRVPHTLAMPVFVAYLIVFREVTQAFGTIGMNRQSLCMSSKQRCVAVLLLAAVLLVEVIGGTWLLLSHKTDPGPGPNPPVYIDPPSSTPESTSQPPPPPPPDPLPLPEPRPPLPPDPWSEHPKR